MKKIKSFEEFDKTNEISHFLANKAADIAADKVGSTKTSELDAGIKYKQNSKFRQYINPIIKNKAEAFGFTSLYRFKYSYRFNLMSNKQKYDILIDLKGDGKYSIKVYDSANNETAVQDLEQNTLNKLKRFIQILIKDESEFDLTQTK